jgi:hypothetical protein
MKTSITGSTPRSYDRVKANSRMWTGTSAGYLALFL